MEWLRANIDDWDVAGVEAQGRHEHEWLRHEREPRTWLFKPARQDRSRAAEEDIAEKLGAEIAKLVGIPVAPVRLACRNGARGALVEDVRPSGWDFQAGQTLMTEVVPDYDPEDKWRRGHNVHNIQRALRRFGRPPQGDLPPSFHAFDVFAGYLVFDALVAHGDRHDRNWAVVGPPASSEASEALCASFDHAAVLGLLQTEAAMHGAIGSGAVLRWASNGRASQFENRGKAATATLVELAAGALELCAPETGTYWRARILSVDRASIDVVTEAAPDLAESTRQFVGELVEVNRGRLLDAIG